MIYEIDIMIGTGLNIQYDVIIIPKRQIIYINDQKYKIPQSFIDELKKTFYLWDENYGYDNKIDTEEFKIIVKSDDGIKKYQGKGHYPNNYGLLKEMLGSIHE